MDNAEVFHVVGLTREDILGGVASKIMRLSDYVMKDMLALNQRYGPLLPAIQSGTLIEEQVEVLFLFDLMDPEGARKYRSGYDKQYQQIEYFNDVAFSLCQQYGIKVPPVLRTITRAELPDPQYLGISIQIRNVRPK